MKRVITFKWFKDIPISWKLYFTVGVMATLIVVELFTLWFAITTLSSLRAYVSGEGLWSKGEKDAVFQLQKYGHTHHEEDYLNFLTFLKVPLGDHKTLVELAKKEPDYNAARQGFLEGRNHPDDIDGMIKLFRRFQFIYYIHKATEVWMGADQQITILIPISEKLHSEISSPNPDPVKIKSLLDQIESTNEKLTKLEDEFSYILGEGSRWLEALILKLLFAVALTVELSGLLLAISVSRSIQRGLKEVIRASNAIAKGDLKARAQAFSKDEIGILAGSINNMADELSKSESRFKKLIETAPDAKVVVNTKGIIRLVNAQTEKMFGYDRFDIIGKSIDLLIPESIAITHPLLLDSTHIGGIHEQFGIRKNNEKFPIEVSLSTLDTDGEVWITSSIRDVSEKKHDHEILKNYAHQLEISNSNLEQFAYVASHDLQEPLRTITSFVSLLNQNHQQNIDKDSSVYMGHIVTAAERMKVLIKDLLMYSRIGKNHSLESVNCTEVVTNVLSDMDLLIKENSAEVSVGILPFITANKIEIHQLFLNLVANAIKYKKPNDTPKVAINAQKTLTGEWLFSVKDNGIGIEKDYYERIFIIFQRLHNQDEYSGTGIGLSTCRKIVELNDGKIWVESQYGQGSIFYFTIPS